jgi:hypothetical protein
VRGNNNQIRKERVEEEYYRLSEDNRKMVMKSPQNGHEKLANLFEQIYFKCLLPGNDRLRASVGVLVQLSSLNRLS